MTLDYFFAVYFISAFMVAFPVLIFRGLIKLFKNK